MIETVFYLTLTLSTLLCALVAGLVFGFAAVVMPGIAKLSDEAFLLTFKNIDGVIQGNQLAFMLVWVGSILTVIATLVLGTLYLKGGLIYLLWAAASLYLLGVQLPTVCFNVPLNNALQDLDLLAINESEMAKFRATFEEPWTRWNTIRTSSAIGAAVAWLVLLARL